MENRVNHLKLEELKVVKKTEETKNKAFQLYQIKLMKEEK